MSSTNLPLNVFKAPEHLQSWRETMFLDTGQHISLFQAKTAPLTYLFFLAVPS